MQALSFRADTMMCYDVILLNDKYTKCVNCSIVMTRARARRFGVGGKLFFVDTYKILVDLGNAVI